MTERTSRAERMARPHIHDVIKTVAEEHGACIRPVQLRKTNLDTGQAEQILVPCRPRSGRCAHHARSAPRPCTRSSAGKAGTSRTSRSHRPARPTTTSGGSRPPWLICTLVRIVAERMRWKQALDQARR
jgi:hypothetical protein